jgi:hypothetical protein
MASRSSGVKFFVLAQLIRNNKAANMIAIVDFMAASMGSGIYFSGE